MDFAVGDFVEAPVTANGASRIAVGVVRGVVPGSAGGEPLVHVDFGPGVKAAPTAETPRGSGPNVLVWKSPADLKKVTGGLKEDQSNQGAASPLRADSVDRSFPAANGEKSNAGSDTANGSSTAQAAAESSPKSAASPTDDEDEVAPTMCDEAAWTMAAGVYAVVSVRRPLITFAYLLFFALAKSLYNEGAGLPDPLGACTHLIAARAEAPLALRALVVDGHLPFGLHERLNVTAEDLRHYHSTFHAVVEGLQRKPATTPGSAADKKVAESLETATKAADEPAASVTPTADAKKVKKPAKKPKTAVTKDAVAPVANSTAPVAPAFTAEQADTCRRAGDLLLTLTTLVLIAGTTAFPFTNARANVARFRKECKAMLYIWSFVIVLFAVLKFTPRSLFEPVDGPTLSWVYDNVVRMHTVTTFTLEQPWMSAAINVVLGVIALPFKMVFFGLEGGGRSL